MHDIAGIGSAPQEGASAGANSVGGGSCVAAVAAQIINHQFPTAQPFGGYFTQDAMNDFFDT